MAATTLRTLPILRRPLRRGNEVLPHRARAQLDMLMYHKDAPEPPPPGVLQPGFENKVTHATLRIGGAVLQLSDGCDDKSRFDGFRLMLRLSTQAEAQRAFDALCDGGRDRHAA